MMISSSKSQDEDDFTPKKPLRYNGQNKEGGEDTKMSEIEEIKKNDEHSKIFRSGGSSIDPEDFQEEEKKKRTGLGSSLTTSSDSSSDSSSSSSSSSENEESMTPESKRISKATKKTRKRAQQRILRDKRQQENEHQMEQIGLALQQQQFLISQVTDGFGIQQGKLREFVQ